MHCAKISREFECQGQRSKVKVTRNKKALSAANTPGCVRMVCARYKQRAAAVDGLISWLAGGVVQLCRPAVLHRWENKRMPSSYCIFCYVLYLYVCFLLASCMTHCSTTC